VGLERAGQGQRTLAVARGGMKSLVMKRTDIWIAIATVVNAVTVIVLAFITYWYARSAKRQAKATEEIATASVQQSKAAHEQALAAQAQAHAARETVGELREQVMTQRVTAHQVVAAAIATAMSQIEHWEGTGVIETRAQRAALPNTVALLPSNHTIAQECATRLSPNVLTDLNSAFNFLQSAQSHIEGMRRSADDVIDMDFIKRESNRARELMSEAKTLLQRLQTDIYTP
jgi:hypothetical protein